MRLVPGQYTKWAIIASDSPFLQLARLMSLAVIIGCFIYKTYEESFLYYANRLAKSLARGW